MADFSGILNVIKQAGKDATDAEYPVAVMFGSVISVNPLEINVEQKMTLKAPQLIVPRGMTDASVQMRTSFVTMPELSTHVHNYNGTTDTTNISHEHEYTGETNTGGTTDPHKHTYEKTTESANPVHAHEYSEVTKPVDLTHYHYFSNILTVTVYNGLKKGDEVILLRVQGGQQFVVLDRLR